MSSYEKDRAQTMRDNKRKLYDLNLLLKFEDSEMAKDYDRVDEPLDQAKFQIGVEVGMLVEDSKRWVVGQDQQHEAPSSNLGKGAQKTQEQGKAKGVRGHHDWKRGGRLYNFILLCEAQDQVSSVSHPP